MVGGIRGLVVTIVSIALLAAACASDGDEQVDEPSGVSTTVEQAFTSVEPFAASRPDAAVSGFWVALSARNFPQALLSVSDACLEDLGGEDGLDVLADRLEQLGLSGLGPVQLDRSNEEAESSGEALASFELERLDWEGWQAADPSESMEDYALPPVQPSDQRYAVVGDSWVLDDECGELEDALSERS